MDDDQSPAPVVESEASEWEQATSDFAADVGYKETKEEPETPAEVTEEKPEVKAEEPKVEEEPKAEEDPSEETSGADPVPTPDTSRVREQRAIQREIIEDRNAVIEDIRTEMFSDVPRELQDADGDPIRTIEDVQKLTNPNTGQPFTDEEAGMWLLAAQQQLTRTLADNDRQVEELAELQLSIKDQADSVKEKYGELLKANPDGIREKVWEAYSETLEKDPKSGIITKAPMSLEKFYEIALKPYAKLAEQMEATAEAKSEVATKTQEVKKVKARADRQDIYSGGKTETMDDQEKEWSEVAKNYYE